jgi:DNA-binding HxlR family transcriptional regulator
MSSARKEASSNAQNQRTLARACVANEVLERISRRWKMQVLYSIRRGVGTFGALKVELPGVSDHVLGRRLRELTLEGLVLRHEVAGAAPPRATYAITRRGVALLSIMQGLCDWAEGEPTAPARGT